MSKKLWLLFILFFLVMMWFASPIPPVPTGDVRLYTSPSLQVNCTRFNYGSVAPFTTHVRYAVLHNNTSVPVILMMNHSAPDYFTFTWNYTDLQVPSHTVLPLRFTLRVDDTEGPFAFNITIRAVEVR